MSDAIERSEAFSEATKGVPKAIERLEKQARRTRAIVWGVALSVALDLVLSVLIGVIGYAAQENAEKAAELAALVQQNAQDLRAACIDKNEANAATVTLWEFVIALSNRDRPPPTAEDRRKSEDLLRFLAEKFPQKPCPERIVSNTD